jgi:hypothetical protein
MCAISEAAHSFQALGSLCERARVLLQVHSVASVKTLMQEVLRNDSDCDLTELSCYCLPPELPHRSVSHPSIHPELGPKGYFCILTQA